MMTVEIDPDYQRVTDKRKVYLFHQAGWTKIGISTDPEKRLKGIQTSTPFEVELVGTITTDDAPVVETLLHTHFSEVNSEVGNEWFAIHNADMKKLQKYLGGYHTWHELSRRFPPDRKTTRVPDLDEERLGPLVDRPYETDIEYSDLYLH